MIKLIASDMDGTLLNDFWRISDENAQAIRRAQSHGIEFMVATGRPYENAHVLTDLIGVKCTIVGLNGATTHDKEGKLIAKQVLSREEVKLIMNSLDKYQIYYELMTNKGAYSIDYDRLYGMLHELGNREMAHLPEDERIKRVEMLHEERIKNENCQFIDSFEDILNDETIDIYKVYSMSSDDDILEQAAVELRQLNQFSVTSGGHMNLEINSINGHKGFAVFNYAQTLGIKPEEVMTIGDNFNDITMLVQAGRGVAMGSAHDDIKSQVRYVTKTNLEHGVAEAIHLMLDEHQLK